MKSEQFTQHLKSSEGSQPGLVPYEAEAAPAGTVDSVVANWRVERPHPGFPAGKPPGPFFKNGTP
jgi:hypothetical protein